MGIPEAALTAMFLMCNPVRDHGPAPGFQGPPSEYEPNAMPAGFGVEEFINTW